jgi:dTDP-4-amino-4,6-dideoxygalactose transaminase
MRLALNPDSKLPAEMKAESTRTDFASAAYFWKGRVALYAILRALNIGPGDAVVVPGYTCVVVPSAVYFVGAKPLYADIDSATFNLTLEEIERASAGQPVRAVVVQHTYGIPVDIGPIRRWAAEREIFVIEDCCHALGSRYRDAADASSNHWQEVGQLGDAAFFSSQWSKPIATGLGGWAISNHRPTAEKLQAFAQEACMAPRCGEAAQLALQVGLHKLLFRPSLYWKAQAALRWLSQRGLMVGSSNAAELELELESDYAKRMTSWQRKMVQQGLANRLLQSDRRRELKTFYDSELARAGLPVLEIPSYADPVLLRYPVRVSNKQAALAAAKAARVELGDWFDHPLHPAGLNLKPLGWKPGVCPHGERAAAEVVNLPMHARVSQGDAKRAVELLRAFR